MPLSRLTVVDLATLGAAPQIAAFFGDFGARVIKVEHPRGDALRRLMDERGAPLTWRIVNRNKQHVTLDVAQPLGREILDRLLARADLLVSNLPRERLARWRLDSKHLARTHPHLVAVNLTAYGVEGPWADRPGSGTLAEAMSGLASLTGSPDGPPGLSPVGLGDYLGVLQGVVAALLGLYARDAGARREGARGETFDVAMYEPILGLLALRLASTARDGRAPARHGNRFPTMAPRNTYATADGRWVAITAGTDELAYRAFRVIGRPELCDDPRFRDNRSRVEHVEELDVLLADWIGARPCDEVVRAFNEAGVSLAAVDDLVTVLANPHFRARQSLVTVEDESGERVVTAAPQPRPSGAPGRIWRLGGALGADNEAVYGEWLGCSAHELASWRARGVI